MVILVDTFLATVTPMLVMFSCILIGYLLRIGKIVPENASTVLSRLVVYVFAPAQAIYAFMQNCTLESIASEYKLVLYGTFAVGLGLVIGVPLAKLFSKEINEQKIYRYALVFANCGFLGNAIVPMILGEQALYCYILFNIPLNITIYSWGYATLTPQGKGEKRSFWSFLRQPTIIAIAVGLVLGLSGLGKHMPTFATSVVSQLSNCMGPSAMLLTGFVVGGYDIRKLLTKKKVYIAAALRMIVLPGIHACAMYFLGADKQTVILAAIAFGAALGLNTVVVPAAYDGDTHTGAAMALISHTASVITIPLLYALLNWIL